jgi:fucose 4-O-acetylase-like acetyltransferase
LLSKFRVARKPGREARDQSIETVRGIAVILMVAAHVIGDSANSGMLVSDDSSWRHAYLSFQWLRMPLFTVVSGYVYDLRPIRRGLVTKFAQGKARRLLIPYFFVSASFIFIQSVVPGVHEHLSYTALPRILVNPYGHFWYLYALAWVFFVVAAADLAGGLSTPRRWLAGLGLAILLSEWSPFATPLFAVSEAYYLLPYFLFGLGLHRYAALFSTRRAVLVAMPLLAVGIAFQQASLLHVWKPTDLQYWLLNTFLGITGAFALFRIRFSWGPLAKIGTYSYGIYLLHVFGTAGARIGLNRAGIGAKGPIFFGALVAGIALPILLEQVIDQVPTLRLLVLGKSTPGQIAEGVVSSA